MMLCYLRKSVCTGLLAIAAYTAIAQSELPITFQHEGYTLNGRLSLPASSPPYRAILIIPGSGANDKDGTIPMVGANSQCLYPGLYGDTLRPYLGLSQALTAAGYAVMTYDKLEYTYTLPPQVITFDKLWMPVRSAISWLKGRSDIDASHLILLGHSEGSSLIPKAALEDLSVKALISLAGPRTPLDTMIARQIVGIAQACGGNVNDAQLTGNQIIDYGVLIRSGNYNNTTPPLFGVPAPVWEQYFHLVDSVAILYNMAQRKTLFIGLGDDLNVPIATELQRFQQEITIPADFYEIEGINHYLTSAQHPEVAKVLTDTIITWLNSALPPVSVMAMEEGQLAGISCFYQEGSLWVENNQGKLGWVELYNASGKRLYREKVQKSKHKIPIAAYPSGMYLVKIHASHASHRVFKVMHW